MCSERGLDQERFASITLEKSLVTGPSWHSGRHGCNPCMCAEGERLEREYAEATKDYTVADIQQRAAMSGDPIRWSWLKEEADRLAQENRAAAERLGDHRRQCRVCLEQAKKREPN